MTEVELGKCLDSAVRRYALWQHPLYRAWLHGALTRDDLREYSMEYYHHIAAFPAYLREFARRLPAGELRHEVFKALCDVEGQNGQGKRPQAAAWGTFAAELGADTTAMRDRKPFPKTQQLIEIFLELARSGSEAEALAAFYAYQSQTWRLAAYKASALREHYGMHEDILEYFLCQGEVTVRHANAWRKQLFKIIHDNPPAITYAVIAAELASKALWRALDGISARREYLMD